MLQASIFDRLSRYAESKLGQLQALFGKGLGPQQANHIVKITSSINPFNQKGVQPFEALGLWKEFKERQTTTLESLPTMRSKRLMKSMATTTVFKSPLGHRYLMDFEFQVRNVVTGKIETIHNTLGFRRLERWGKVQDAMTDRINAMIAISEQEQESIYTPLGSDYIPETLVVTGFFRTLNN